MNGSIFDIQPFSLHDGPGTRTTVFMQGCDLRCKWCHNPESQLQNGAMLFYPAKCVGCGACAEVCPNAKDGKRVLHTDACTACGACAEACYAEAVRKSGRAISVEALTKILLKDADIYRDSGGGVTFSGGEPLLQAGFVAAAARKMKDNGIKTAVETCLCVSRESLEAVLDGIDLFYADLKCADPETHRAGTGADNAVILDNIRFLCSADRNVILRTPVVPGFNASEAAVTDIGRFMLTLEHVPPIELMAFHRMCAPKYAALGRTFECETVREPDRAEMENLTRILTDMGIRASYRM